jgi:hypothetical protein
MMGAVFSARQQAIAAVHEQMANRFRAARSHFAARGGRLVEMARRGGEFFYTVEYPTNIPRVPRCNV